MITLPRMMSVDPSSTAARLVRAALDLLNRPAIHIHIPNPLEALDELSRADFNLLITSAALDGSLSGVDFAVRVKQTFPEISVILLGDGVTPLHAETVAAAPLLYIPHPLDSVQFIRAMSAVMDGRDVLTAQFEPAARAAVQGAHEMGAVPFLDVKAAAMIVDKLLVDIGAIAIVLSNRIGEVLLERGAVGYFNRETLTAALMPTVMTTFELSKVVGGKASSLGFYDGDQYDVFVLSAGLHHMVSLIFDGTNGRSQFGAVNRYGRRAAEDLTTLIGTGAYMVEAAHEARATMEIHRLQEQARTVVPEPEPEPALVPERRGRRRAAPTPEPQIQPDRPLERAPEFMTPDAPEPVFVRADEWDQSPLPVPDGAPMFEPIEHLDMSLLDPALLDAFDSALADDMFDMDKMAVMATETRSTRGPLTYEEARELGIIQ